MHYFVVVTGYKDKKYGRKWVKYFSTIVVEFSQQAETYKTVAKKPSINRSILKCFCSIEIRNVEIVTWMYNSFISHDLFTYPPLVEKIGNKIKSTLCFRISESTLCFWTIESTLCFGQSYETSAREHNITIWRKIGEIVTPTITTVLSTL